MGVAKEFLDRAADFAVFIIAVVLLTVVALVFGRLIAGIVFTVILIVVLHLHAPPFCLCYCRKQYNYFSASAFIFAKTGGNFYASIYLLSSSSFTPNKALITEIANAHWITKSIAQNTCENRCLSTSIKLYVDDDIAERIAKPKAHQSLIKSSL